VTAVDAELARVTVDAELARVTAVDASAGA
jgi:hypothetical protein